MISRVAFLRNSVELWYDRVSMSCRRALWLVTALAAACGQNGPVTHCVPMSGPGPLVTGAKLLKLDLFPPTVGCAGDTVARNAGAPLFSRSFHPGDKVTVDVAPGHYTVGFTTYADAAGTIEIGSACASADLKPGAQFCLDVTVGPAPDLAAPGGDDGSMMCTGAQCSCAVDGDCHQPAFPRCGPGKVCVPCLPTNDNCPADQYCNSSLLCSTGCKLDSDCGGEGGAPDGGMGDGGVGGATPFCDTTRHTCVQCLSQNDCPVGELCSPSGACVLGCDLSMGKGCPGTLSCCNKLCVDTRSDPLNCSGCNMPCTGAKTLCCNSVCADPSSEVANCGGCNKPCSSLNATPHCSTGMCSWTCDPNFQHCMTGNTGCETSTTTTTDCGGCRNACDGSNATSTTCSGTTCVYMCKPGFADCQPTAPDTNGCETNLTATSQKLCGTMCVAASSCCSAADCTSSPTPAACYTPTCATAGGSCTYPQKAGSQVCGSTCCLPIAGTCNAGTCTLNCNAGFADCNGNRADGCETNLATAGLKLCPGGQCVATGTCCTNADCTTPPTPTACYAASGTCPAPGGTCSYTQVAGSQICGSTCCLPIGGTCNAGTCTLSCNSGLGDCDSNRTNGCETNTNSSTTHCGGCGRACLTAAPVATASCMNGLCNSTCTGGSGNCTQPAYPAADNGCETNTGNDPNNCGACNRACSGTQTAMLNCSGGLCTSTCSGGFLNCATPAAPTTDDGCECPPTTTACCSGPARCQSIHNNGVGGTYNDCVMPGTYNSTQAIEAANSATGLPGTPSDGWTCGVGANTATGVCRTAGNGSSGACTCWIYAATGNDVSWIGHVRTEPANGCFCATNADSPWN
jgi:hypothetical protein